MFGGGAGSQWQGINEELVDTAKGKIEEYYVALTNHLNSIEYGNINIAFKGASAAVLDSAVKRICSEAKNALKTISEFDERLNQARANYQQADGATSAGAGING